MRIKCELQHTAFADEFEADVTWFLVPLAIHAHHSAAVPVQWHVRIPVRIVLCAGAVCPHPVIMENVLTPVFVQS